ncbi:MAG: peptidylprolyl isomerase [Thermodesulfobacteriota bacterium]|nr:peptidylprolyl isomerase [Thermodesulfobacteriota bacterium]
MKLSSIRRFWFIQAITISLVILTGLSAVQGADTAKDQVAVVNGIVITRQELENEVIRAKNRMATQGQPVPDGTIEKIDQKILDQLIDMEILLQESQKQNIQITDTSVADHLAKFRARFPSAEAYEKALKELNVSETDLKEKTMKGLAIQELIEKQVMSKIEISDADRRGFYDSNPNFFEQPEQIEARHILIKSDPKDDKIQQEKALEKIKEAQQQAKAGEDFADLAKKYSEGPSGKNGGDLGYFGRGQMVKPFEDTAFALEPGQISNIVKTRFGYHLIMVTGKKAARTIPYEEVKEKIGAQLKQQKTSESIKVYIEKLKKEAKIEKSL